MSVILLHLLSLFSIIHHLYMSKQNPLDTEENSIMNYRQFENINLHIILMKLFTEFKYLMSLSQ